MTVVVFSIMVLLLIGGLITYLLFLGIIYRGLGNVRKMKLTAPKILPTISVVIPARNEQDTIGDTLKYLLNQDYPENLLQIIVVNDRSTDATADIVTEFSQQHPHIELLTLHDCPPSMSPKKHALTEGIQNATGDIIVTTDADCRFHPRWLSNLVGYFTPDVGVVAGLTRFYLQKDFLPLWQKIQWLDFLSHSFVSAGAIGFGQAFNCNGSNLAYRRDVFKEVDGFSGVDRIVSGDDEFFAQKVNRQTKWKIRFAHEPESIVLSKPVETLKELFHQRFRWGSKGLYYRPFLKSILIITYIYYLTLFLTPLFCVIASIAKQSQLSSFLLLWIISIWVVSLLGKVGMDLSVLLRGCRVFGIRRVLQPIVPAEILHIPMIVLFATAGHLFSFRWKGTNFRSVRHPQKVAMSSSLRQ